MSMYRSRYEADLAVSVISFNYHKLQELTQSLYLSLNRIGGIMVSMLASFAVDRGFDPDRVNPKTIKFIYVASTLCTEH
jgi:ABC-type uncharacterized transport system permease subunit